MLGLQAAGSYAVLEQPFPNSAFSPAAAGEKVVTFHESVDACPGAIVLGVAEKRITGAARIVRQDVGSHLRTSVVPAYTRASL